MSPTVDSPTAPFTAVALIDRDGTLITEGNYIKDPDKVELLPRAARALKLARALGYCTVLTTNQAGVAKGYFTEDDVRAVNARFVELLAAQGAALDAMYYAPQHAEAIEPRYRQDLHHRKPGRGMYDQACRDLPIAGLPVYAIGDRAADIGLGRNAGGKGIMLRTGWGERTLIDGAAEIVGAPVVPDAYDAIRWMHLDRVRAALPDDPGLATKLKTPGELGEIVRARRNQGHRIVLANGCFDLLHGGHVSFLEDARSAGDALVLAVNSQQSIARLKGAGRPLLDEADRLALLAAFESVDYLTVFHDDSADEVLEEIHPSAHAKGTDYRTDNVPERATAQRLGIETVIAGASKENSTRDIVTTVIERVKAGLL